MNSNDLIVVIPGITGSTLHREDGSVVWSTRYASLLPAIAILGRHLRELTLPSEIGDDAPEDGVQAGELLPRLSVIPGLWAPFGGYAPLVSRVDSLLPGRGVDYPRELNPLVFPYDWRLSNRYTARQLKHHVESALMRWRDAAPQNRDAQITFVCHSMGGLIARWYIAREGGASVTRKLITFGTPYRGSLKALSVLANGPLPILRKFGEHLHKAALSFPSVHQLLPSYACVNGTSGLETLGSQAELPIPTFMCADAQQFYSALEAAEASDRESHTRRHAIIGSKQPTPATVSLSGGRIRLSSELDGHILAGDGTVSVASGPKGIMLDDNSLRRIADKHGNLQCNQGALDEMESIVSSRPILVKAADPPEFSVEVPELIAQGERLIARVRSASGRCAVVVDVRDETGQLVERRQGVIRTDVLEHVVTDLSPGGYSLTVNPVDDATRGVTSSLLVWPG